MSKEVINTAKVKKYECLFSNQINKKPFNRIYTDGYLRIHHSNCKTYLMSTDFVILSETFYISNSFLTKKLNNSNGGSSLSDNFTFEEGDEVEFDNYIVQVGDLVEERITNLTQIQNDTKDLKKKSKLEVKAWAEDQDLKQSTPKPKPRSTSTTSTPSTGTKSNSTSTSTNAIASTSTSSTYKGFSIKPPQSYNQTSTSKSIPTKAKSNALIRPSISLTKIKPRSLYSPYSREVSQNQNQPSTPISKFNTLTSIINEDNNNNKHLELIKSPYSTSTPSRATSKAFKAPSLRKEILKDVDRGKIKFSPGLNLRNQSSGGGMEGSRGAIENKTLAMNWNKFGGSSRMEE